MPLAIRPATLDDAETLADLNVDVQALHAAAEPERYRPPQRDAFVPWFRQLLSQPDHECLLAVRDDVAVGFASLRIIRKPSNAHAHAQDFLQVDALAVAPGARRSGCGRALMAAVQRRASELGLADIELQVRSFNADAIAFYASLGYSPSAHIMRKPVEG